MSDLINAYQAARAEAQRLGYGPLDDRILIAYDRVRRAALAAEIDELKRQKAAVLMLCDRADDHPHECDGEFGPNFVYAVDPDDIREIYGGGQ